MISSKDRGSVGGGGVEDRDGGSAKEPLACLRRRY